ncbi:hypothetical protein [Facilibium subflavum]|uniref:hypothetical protein n=1 Tax=Facilibium subflavum TaxID=2219058 RepID=UPI000E648D0F|nr:hypothetical protein [Facilibium subflavum]
MQLIMEKTAISAMYHLVQEGEKNSGVFLEEDLQAFIVYALLRNIRNNALKDFVFAEELLSAIQSMSIKRLEVILDHALIYAGMYPKRVKKAGLSKTYYCDIGISASEHLSVYHAKLRSSYEEVYRKIAKQFDELVYVLKSLIIPDTVQQYVHVQLRRY